MPSNAIKYIVRQPIKDMNGKIMAHEIRYAGENSAYDIEGQDFAAADTIYSFLTQNSTKVLKDTLSFMTFTSNLLMRQTPKLFNPGTLVIQVDDSVIINPLAMRFVERYSKEGYKLAVNDFQFSPRYFSIIDKFDYIKINFQTVADSSIRNIVDLAHSMKKKCIATGIDDEDLYQKAFIMEVDAMEGRWVAEKLFTIDNMLVSYTADEKGFGTLKEAMKKLTKDLPEGKKETYPFVFDGGNKNEGFKTSSQVNYVARCGNFRTGGFAGEEGEDGFPGYEYTGELRILRLILSYDYLWLNLRVKGGAYGCMSGFGRSGEGYFVSYRDPGMARTNEVYEKIVEYLESFDVDERDMTKYVIGTVSAMDTPFTPADKGARGLSGYLSGVTGEMLQQERDEVLKAQPEDIRRLAGIVKAILDTGSLCTIGNEEKIESDRGMFGEVKSLYNG